MTVRRRVTGFIDPDSGELREMLNPDGPATGRQLRRLNLEGQLELVEPGGAEPLTKAEAAAGIDDARDAAGAHRPRIHKPPRSADETPAADRSS